MTIPLPRLEIGVDDVLDQLLAAAAVGGDVAFLEHRFFERGEVVFAGFYFRA